MSQINLKTSKWPQTWYPVRRSDELARGQVMPIRALGDDYILVRSPEGAVSFLDGHCTHRGASLGHGGKFVGECIQCPFHGLEYNLDGRCVKVPGTNRIPKAAVLRRFPVAESMGMIWMFYGPKPTFPPPSLEDCGPVSEVGHLGKLTTSYAFRNVRHCLMRDSICGSLDYQHGNLVHDLKAVLESLEQPTPHELIITLDVEHTSNGYLGHRKLFGLGRRVKYRGHYWGPAIVYTRSWGDRQLLGHIRACLPIEENVTQTDMLMIVKLRRNGSVPRAQVAMRKFFARHQDDEDAFLDRQKPRAMYMKDFDEGMIAHHRMCMRFGQNAFEGREPFMIQETGEEAQFGSGGAIVQPSFSQE
jgi:phenylpropionate dioxygenase-like ring-hydroxylating dioxygenase large terminal subunit